MNLLRIAQLGGVWLLAWLPLALPIARAVQWQPGRAFTPQQKLPLMLSLYVVAIPVLWLLSRRWGIPLSAYGWDLHSPFWTQLGVGFGIATLSLSFFYGVQVLMGWIEGRSPTQRRDWLLLIPLLALASWVSVTEELMFRGFLQQELTTHLTFFWAAVIGSIIFALLHFVWEPWIKEWPQLPGLVLLGIVLCLARWSAQGSLALAIGLHAGWVWGIASGDSLNLWHQSERQPRWVGGEPGKPIASGLGLLMLLLVACALWELRRQI
jgi:uncharacterized protein